MERRREGEGKERKGKERRRGINSDAQRWPHHAEKV